MVDTGARRICLPSYVGISGAAHNDTGRYSEPRFTVCFGASSCGSIGTYPEGALLSGGTLLAYEVKRQRDGIDGTSNTIAVAEASDWVLAPDGIRVEGGFNAGWVVGTNSAASATLSRVHNLMAIIHRPSCQIPFGWAGITPDDGRGANPSLISAHAGGFRIVLADGSVRVLSENI